jgi:hypothetical protein
LRAPLPLFAVALLAAPLLACAATPGHLDLNAYVLRAVEEMPVGGSYSTDSSAGRGLIAAVQVRPELAIDATRAQPSFCTSATYLVLLKALQRLRADGHFSVPATILPRLAPPESLISLFKDDGKEIWGRWNANGPGTARLFHELGAGVNFVDWEKKRPGDFMKIFWRDTVGGPHERGHSVIYLAERKNPETREVEIQYWSSDRAGGYGKKWVSRSRITHAIFSRLTAPNAIANIASLPETDTYLKNLLTMPSTYDEAKRQAGVTDSEQ